MLDSGNELYVQVVVFYSDYLFYGYVCYLLEKFSIIWINGGRDALGRLLVGRLPVIKPTIITTVIKITILFTIISLRSLSLGRLPIINIPTFNTTYSIIESLGS